MLSLSYCEEVSPVLIGFPGLTKMSLITPARERIFHFPSSLLQVLVQHLLLQLCPGFFTKDITVPDITAFTGSPLPEDGFETGADAT